MKISAGEDGEMARSMTGFGRGSVSLPGRKLQVELRAVNNRYCELLVKLPHALLPLEQSLRAQITSTIHRGKIEAYISYENQEEGARHVVTDTNLAAAYRDALEGLGEELERPYLSRIPDLLTFPGIFTASENDLDLDRWKPLVEEALDQALQQLEGSREVEGARLTEDILQRIDLLRQYRSRVMSRAPQLQTEYRERLEKKMRDLLDRREIDENRLLLEVALYADRSDVTEELTRLDSHLLLFEETLATEGAVGKKLDFVVQELNREVNTLGSKANDPEVVRLVVEMKSEIEKIREQIQNLE